MLPATLRLWGPLTAAACLLGTTSCSSALQYHLTDKPDVYTLVNLHPDEANARLYSINYQQAGLIPRCTKVDITRVSAKAMTFTVLDGGKQYSYLLHGATQGTFVDHLDKYFGETCDAEASGMSELDRTGVEQGKATEGMSKEAVVMAMGYPPEHETPSTDGDEWKYWKNRWVTMVVVFKNGFVSEIRG